ncbi:MAG: thioredoxin [Candidatus Bathyarchaeota archaeon]|nr:thioredoxin [Candidatus Bathyarchaeota archaeon]
MNEEDREFEEIKRKKIMEMMEKLKKSGQLNNEAKILGKPVDVSDENFQSFVGAYKFVVVDFWASWCPPCRMVAPIVEKLAKQYAGKVVFAKVDVDQNLKTASMYNITAIPTLVFFKNGVEVERIIGALPESELKQAVEKLLSEG